MPPNFLTKPSLQQLAITLLFLAQNYTYELQLHFAATNLDYIHIALIIHHYILLPFIFFDFFIVITAQTRDPLLTKTCKQQDYPPQNLISCVFCDSLVLRSSYHCWRCHRCCADFDHHCKFLNCCIGQVNYISFLRLLLLYGLFCANLVGQIVIAEEIGTVLKVVGVGSVVGLVFVWGLLVFHMYINLRLKVTTLEYLKGSRNKDKMVGQIIQAKGSSNQLQQQNDSAR